MTTGDLADVVDGRHAGLGQDIHDSAVYAEVELVARLVAAAAASPGRLSDAELDQILLD